MISESLPLAGDARTQNEEEREGGKNCEMGSKKLLSHFSRINASSQLHFNYTLFN
jgi:hypothetical protein